MLSDAFCEGGYRRRHDKLTNKSDLNGHSARIHINLRDFLG